MVSFPQLRRPNDFFGARGSELADEVAESGRESAPVGVEFEESVMGGTWGGVAGRATLPTSVRYFTAQGLL